MDGRAARSFGGARDFVLERNPELARASSNNRALKNSFEDLKAEVPKLDDDFHQNQRHNSPKNLKRPRSSTVKQEHSRNTGSRAQLGTGEDTITISSEGSETSRLSAGGARSNGKQLDHRSPSSSPRPTTAYGFASPPGMPNTDVVANGMLNPVQLAVMHDVDSRRMGYSEGLQDFYMEGDSYPSSMSERGMFAGADEAPNMQPYEMSPGNVFRDRNDVPVYDTKFVSGKRVVDVRMGMSGFGHEQRQGGEHQTGFATRPEPAADAGRGSFFRQPQDDGMRQLLGSPRPRTARRHDREEQAPQQMTNANAINSTTAVKFQPQGQRTTAVDSNKRQNSVVDRTTHYVHAQQLQSQHRHFNGEVLLSPPNDNDLKTSGQRSLDKSHNAHEGLEDNDQRNDPVAHIQLDIDPPKLFAMKFEEVKSQAFDKDPRATPLNIKGVRANDTLDVKLQAVSSLSSGDQERFLSSLTLDQWDEAGEWFVQQFAQLAERFRVVRKRRREASRALEESVEARSRAVEAKREQLEAAMQDMRANGRLVLQGTPRR